MEQVEEWLLPVSVYRSATELGTLAKVRLPIVLQFGQQAEQVRNWHWLAVAASISAFLRPAPWTQCRIASAEFAPLECCPHPAPGGGCDRSGVPGNAMETAEIFEDDEPAKAEFARVRGAILLRQPIGVGIVWQQNARHSVSIFGYAIYQGAGAEDAELMVGDPWQGNSWVVYETFPRYYAGGGEWTETVFSE